MDYISAEEFLKQPEKVQKVLLNWWKGNCTGNDLVYNNENKKIDIFKNVSGLYCLYPLFTETQLRKFIEEKTECTFDVAVEGISFDKSKWEYGISCYTYDPVDEGFDSKVSYSIEATDLLEAYWQIACKIAEEG